jgi:hypothetical protein
LYSTKYKYYEGDVIRRMRWAERVTCMMALRNSHEALCGRSAENR